MHLAAAINAEFRTAVMPGSLPRIAADRAAKLAAPYTLVPSRGLLFSAATLIGAGARILRQTRSTVVVQYTDASRGAQPITHAMPRSRLRIAARSPRAAGARPCRRKP